MEAWNILGNILLVIIGFIWVIAVFIKIPIISFISSTDDYGFNPVIFLIALVVLETPALIYYFVLS